MDISDISSTFPDPFDSAITGEENSEHVGQFPPYSVSLTDNEMSPCPTGPPSSPASNCASCGSDSPMMEDSFNSPVMERKIGKHSRSDSDDETSASDTNGIVSTHQHKRHKMDIASTEEATAQTPESCPVFLSQDNRT